MIWFDRNDARLAAKVAVVVAAGASLVITVAAVFGLAWRVFSVMAG